MSTHEFTIRVEVDEDWLHTRNAQVVERLTGTPLDEDPSEWDGRDLVLALDEEVATVEVTDYRAVPA